MHWRRWMVPCNCVSTTGGLNNWKPLPNLLSHSCIFALFNPFAKKLNLYPILLLRLLLLLIKPVVSASKKRSWAWTSPTHLYNLISNLLLRTPIHIVTPIVCDPSHEPHVHIEWTHASCTHTVPLLVQTNLSMTSNSWNCNTLGKHSKWKVRCSHNIN